MAVTGRSRPVEMLRELGLKETEAKTLLAIHSLGSATAREIAKVSGVARSQVYGVADDLEQRGFIHVQMTSPKEYHPATPTETRELFRERFERRLTTVVEHLEELQDSRERPDETREDVWTIRGRDAIDLRITRLLDTAESRVLHWVSRPSLLSDTVKSRLETLAREGVEVTVLGSSPDLGEAFDADSRVRVARPLEHMQDTDREGRLLVVDSHATLHSVVTAAAPTGTTTEVAYWSSHSGFAATFIAVIEQAFQEVW